MSEASSEIARRSRDEGRRPWSQAWIDRLPIAPAWAGCVLAAGHVASAALYFAVFDRARTNMAWLAYEGVLLSTLVYALLIGYAAAALTYARRGHEASLRAIEPALGCSEADRSALRREVLRFQMTSLRWFGSTFAVGAVIATYFTTDTPQRFASGHPALPWVLWQNAASFWLLARTIAHDLRVSIAFSRATERHAEIELLDLTPLSPLAGRGLHSALLIVLAISLFSLIFGAGEDISPIVPVMQTATVLLAGFALALPSLGVRRRVRDAKREELSRLSQEIRAIRASTAEREGPNPSENESRLATLLTLRGHVSAAREWPIDLGTMGRFVIYAVLGVGSWLGAATVERLLDFLLHQAGP